MKNHQDLMEEMKLHCGSSLGAYLEIFSNMVSINSYSANAAGVNELGEYTARLFSGLGFDSEFVQSADPACGRHLLCVANAGAAASVACMSHLDTVYSPLEEEEREFRFLVDSDRIYGPGTCDIKGGTLVLYMMMECLRRFAPQFFSSVGWRLFFDATEETVSDDFGALCLERMDAGTRACLVFESGAFSRGFFPLVTARKGRAIFSVESEDAGPRRTSHGEGLNAIVGISSLIKELSDLTDYSRGVTVNVGSVHGGGEVNRVPDRARAEMELRAFDDGAFRETADKILSFNSPDTFQGSRPASCRTVIRKIRSVPSWPENEGSERLLSVWRRAARQMGYDVVAEHRGGLATANGYGAGFRAGWPGS
jgi:glutamate carboxypeptidase